MAKIKEMIGEKIISGFKGTLDFYYYMGIACVRAWPRSPGHKRAPAVEARWAAFAWAAHNWLQVSPAVRDAYIWTAQTSSLTPRDLFTKAFITSYFREGQWD